MIFEFDSVTEFLQQDFSRRIRVNPRYSMRAYARTLGLSSGALSEIMRERRPLSLKSANKIARSLGLNGIETKRLFEFVEVEKRKQIGGQQNETLPPSTLKQRQLAEDTFHLVSEWYHFAILNLIDCENFLWESSHIAKRLGLTQAQAQTAMNLLLRLGLVQKANGKVKCAQDYVLSSDGIPSTAVRKYHRQMLEKAAEALELQKIDDREISGIGLALDPKRIPQIKRGISQFQDQLITKYSKGKRQEVYFLETAFFRLTGRLK